MSSFRWSPSGQDTEVEWIAFQSCLWCLWFSPAYVDILSFQRLARLEFTDRTTTGRFLFNLKEQKPILPPTSSLIPPLSNPSSTVDSRKRKRTFVTNLRDQSKSKPNLFASSSLGLGFHGSSLFPSIRRLPCVEGLLFTSVNGRNLLI